MAKPMHRIAIRSIDLIAASILLVLLAIPMTVIALAIRLSDGGPALFRQPRVGRDLRIFSVYKFRTMKVAPPGSGSVRTGAGDSRITKMGSFLRPAHLDELPQLFNILKGEMSFVGVRPDTPLQEDDYSPDYWHARHAQLPGLTGPAQIIRGDLNLSQRSAAEQTWLNAPTLPRYFAILIATFGKVLSRSSN